MRQAAQALGERRLADARALSQMAESLSRTATREPKTPLEFILQALRDTAFRTEIFRIDPDKPDDPRHCGEAGVLGAVVGAGPTGERVSCPYIQVITDAEFEAATRAGEEFRRNNPHAVSARYDPGGVELVMLSSGLEIADVQGLEYGTPDQLAEVEILGVGYGLHWESLDADVYVPALLQGVTGTKAWMAARARRPEAA